MRNCKRYKSTANGIEAVYHQQDATGCLGCVYFSNQNCRIHTDCQDAASMIGIG